MNFDPVDDFKLRERSQKTAKEFIDSIGGRFDDPDRRFVSLSSTC